MNSDQNDFCVKQPKASNFRVLIWSKKDYLQKLSAQLWSA